MSSDQRQTRTLTSDTRIEAALGLLAMLTKARGNRVAAAAARRDLALGVRQLDEVVTLLQTLADARTGARVLIFVENDDIVLGGDAGELAPLRLTDDEALAVTQVLARYQLDEQIRGRIERALMPWGGRQGGNGSLLAGDALFGGFYQQIVEAIQDGVRCRLTYRSDRDERAGTRAVDPGFIEVAGSTAYLIAWDVQKNAQRRYRLDRISDIAYTDDSVERHAFARRSPAESLHSCGSVATLAFASRSAAEALDWAGIDLAAGRERKNGTFVAPVSYATEAWLFDQVLAGAGAISIVDPADVRERLLAYAATLLA